MKTIAASFTDEIALKSFVNEGNLAVGIRHPNVIEYLFFHDGSKFNALPPYILMEFAEGGTLEKQISLAQQNKKLFSNDELIEMFKQLIAGMSAVNEKLIHRDVKPDNILICNNTLKISDFGLSKVVSEATRKSSFKGFGCLPYMAPEAWRFERNTLLLDIYSMGIVFYQLATLRHPFDVPNADQQKWMDAHLHKPVARPDSINPQLSPKLSQIIIRMVEKVATKRLQSWANIEEILASSETACGAALGAADREVVHAGRLGGVPLAASAGAAGDGVIEQPGERRGIHEEVRGDLPLDERPVRNEGQVGVAEFFRHADGATDSGGPEGWPDQGAGGESADGAGLLRRFDFG